MFDTLFYIFVTCSEENRVELGPYLSFEHAAEILIDHCDIIVKSEWKDTPLSYSAAIMECVLKDNSKEIVNKKIEEIRFLK